MFAKLPEKQKSRCSSEMLEDAQATLSSADKKPTSSPTGGSEHLAPPTGDVENNTTEKHTKGRNVWSGFRTAWKAVKHPFQTHKNKVCLLVPDQEPSPVHQHASSLEPAPDTEPLESEPTDKKHAKGRNDYVRSLTAWKALRHRSLMNFYAYDPEPTDGSFDLLYEVGQKLRSGCHGIVYEGIRKSDGKQVAIKFVKKCQPENPIELAGYSKPMSREAAIMLMLQKPPNGDHVIQLYDWFVMADQDIFIMEYPGTSMTLFDFIQQNGGRLTEAAAKGIMQRLIVALQHCEERCVYHNHTDLRNILIKPHTMQLKLADFGSARLVGRRRRDEPTSVASIRELALLATTEDLYTVLVGMVKGIRFKFWEDACLSKECLDLLEKFQNRESWITLQAILDHDWFK